jgi:hypothetical protein
MSDRYDAKAAEVRRQYGFNELHVAALARESVREAMVDLASRMCPECRNAHMPTATECGTWFEHKRKDYEIGCTASHVWKWLTSQTS